MAIILMMIVICLIIFLFSSLVVNFFSYADSAAND
jgi:hypothetical protein